jgi:hypothetical protein
MIKVLCIPTVRPESLKKLLSSIVELNILQDWKIYIYFQCYTEEEIKSIYSLYGDIINGDYTSPYRIAPYIARCRLMENVKADIFCVNDDDAVFMNLVDYETPIQKILQDPKCGMISTNWVRVNTPKMMARKRYEKEFKSQNIVNTGGGLLFSDKVRDAVLKKPIKAYLFDDIMLSLNAYISGYKNYRYLGSIIEHNAVMNGGIRTLYKEQKMELLPDKYINMKKTKSIYPYENNNYHMPTAKDLTEKAKYLHNINYENI